MREQLQALATYCEERWIGKIGRQELSFGVSNEGEALEVPVAGVRRPSRLNVEERRRAAQRLAEAAKAEAEAAWKAAKAETKSNEWEDLLERQLNELQAVRKALLAADQRAEWAT